MCHEMAPLCRDMPLLWPVCEVICPFYGLCSSNVALRPQRPYGLLGTGGSPVSFFGFYVA